MTVGHLEVGADVGHVDVVAVLEEVERLRTKSATVGGGGRRTRERSSLTQNVTELERIPCWRITGWPTGGNQNRTRHFCGEYSRDLCFFEVRWCMRSTNPSSVSTSMSSHWSARVSNAQTKQRDLSHLVAEKVGVVPAAWLVSCCLAGGRELTDSARELKRSPEIRCSQSFSVMARGGSLWNGLDFFMM